MFEIENKHGVQKGHDVSISFLLSKNGLRQKEAVKTSILTGGENLLSMVP